MTTDNITDFETSLRFLAERLPYTFKFDSECFEWLPSGFDRTKKAFQTEYLGQDDLDEVLALIGMAYQVTYIRSGWHFGLAQIKFIDNNWINLRSDQSFPTKLLAAKAAFIAAVKEWSKSANDQ